MSYKLVFEEMMDKEKINKKFCKRSNSCIHLFIEIYLPLYWKNIHKYSHCGMMKNEKFLSEE